MEDAATAEISRSQVWQQIKNGVVLSDTGDTVTKELVARILDEEVAKLREQVPAEQFEKYYVPASALISGRAATNSAISGESMGAFSRPMLSWASWNT